MSLNLFFMTFTLCMVCEKLMRIGRGGQVNNSPGKRMLAWTTVKEQMRGNGVV